MRLVRNWIVRHKERSCMKYQNYKSVACFSVFVAIGLLLMVNLCMAASSLETDLSSLNARPSPKWLTQGVMYQIAPRSFTDEGTLKAATEKLPHVADLGATVVYLLPVFLQDDDTRLETWSPRQKASGANSPLNPYRIMDHNRIDPEYGNEADLHEFVKTVHDLGMYVLLDMVYCHCGPNSVLTKNPDFLKRDAKGNVVTGPWNWPELNFENRGLRSYYIANMEHWVKDFHVDGFRCDVSDRIPLDFWEEARDYLDLIRSDLVILAEGHRQADQVKAFDINYNSYWYSAATKVIVNNQPATSIHEIWKKQRNERPNGALFIRYTDNHDISNEMLRPDVILSERGAWAVSVINFTIDGVPFIYNGQEIGDNCAHSIFTNWPIRWKAAVMPKKQKTLEFYKKLCQLRRNHSALHDGDVAWVDHDQPNDVVAFLRNDGKEEILTVVNLSSRSTKVTFDLTATSVRYDMLLSSDATDISEGKNLQLELNGFGYFVGKM